VPFNAEDILKVAQHRPWPVPRRPWVMRQTWENLLFAHWPVSPERMRKLVPAELELDTYEATCWVAVTPFRLTGLRFRYAPPLPFGSDFPELNVRTYVEHKSRPGVFFFSLDAGSMAAVMGARATYHLPYFFADMSIAEESGWFSYSSKRHDDASVCFRGRYRPIGEPDTHHHQPGTHEHWLTERYCLYSLSEGKLYRGDIHHVPWPLQSAECVIEENTMAAAAGIELPDVPPLLHFARELDVLIWLAEEIA